MRLHVSYRLILFHFPFVNHFVHSLYFSCCVILNVKQHFLCFSCWLWLNSPWAVCMQWYLLYSLCWLWAHIHAAEDSFPALAVHPAGGDPTDTREETIEELTENSSHIHSRCSKTLETYADRGWNSFYCWKQFRKWIK